MMLLSRIALLLITCAGALTSLGYAWRDFQVYYDASDFSDSSVWQPPLFSEVYLYGVIGLLLSLVCILLIFSLARHLRTTGIATIPNTIEKRNYLAVVLLVVLLATPVFFPAHATVSGVQNGQPLVVSQQLAARKLEMFAIRLLVSCDYEAKKDIATEERWQQTLGKPHLHLIFLEPRRFAFPLLSPESRPVFAEEIVIPISHNHAPDYALVKCSGQMRAFTLFSCDAMTDLQKLLPDDSRP